MIQNRNKILEKVEKLIKMYNQDELGGEVVPRMRNHI